MLYNATYDLYNEELQSNMINMEGLISLILIIASTIYKIETNRWMNIENILSYVVYACNLEQGVTTYNSQTKEFEKFCSNLNIPSNSKKLKKGWVKIVLRKYNFGGDVNPIDLTKNDLAEMAYLVLNDYI